jgi:hypothetical protein
MIEDPIPPEHSFSEMRTSLDDRAVGDRELIEDAIAIAERIARYRHMLDVDLAERDFVVLRMRQAGFTYDQIGEALSVSAARARILARAAVHREEWPTQGAADTAALLSGQASSEYRRFRSGPTSRWR